MNKLKEIRISKGLTQSELAKRYSLVLGKNEPVKVSTISRCENASYLKPVTVLAMAQALGVSPADIMGDSFYINFTKTGDLPRNDLDFASDILMDLERIERDLNAVINRCNGMLDACKMLTEKVLNAGKDESHD